MSTVEINHVTDTALWIAAYREQESQRKDALFNDSYASLLIGPDAHALATRTQGSRYTAWSVVMRTFIIDQFIHSLIQKVDTVLNLGAGLDTRPYRLELPSDLRWIEVDFSQIIDHKEERLKNVTSRCKLERVKLDLSKTELRDDFLKKISGESKNVLVITEGVIPYLSNDDAHSLASALFEQHNFHYWITEYYSPEILEFLRTPKRLKQMQNAPFLFYPDDWFGFFKNIGWHESLTRYFGVESHKLGRTPPTQGWMKNQSEKDAADFFLGYSILKRKN